VEDIIDSGHTLARLSKVLKGAGADSVKVVALLDKKGRRRVEFFPDYVGWEVRADCGIRLGRGGLPQVDTFREWHCLPRKDPTARKPCRNKWHIARVGDRLQEQVQDGD
jgi:hypothetical protein